MSFSMVAPRPAISFADAKAGFLVFLIALPLCLGIAMASSFPPVAGVLTAIVGGVAVTFFGSSRLTIKGPAAGLIVIALGAVQELGQGDLEPLELLAEIPRSIAQANPEILLLGALALLILFGLPRMRARWARLVPGPMVVLAATVPLGIWFDLDHEHTYSLFATRFHVGPEFLVALPGSLLGAVALPDFSQILTATSLEYVVMFALVGTIESTLSVIAVDAMDPKRQPSDLNRDLLGVGVGNLVAAMIGGLPMISEIVRSKANVDAGARSSWANFFHGLFLLAFVALVPGLLHRIPLAALAAMLVYTGARLASPSELRHARSIGPDQLLLFSTTLLVTLASDLLIGVAAGLALKIALHLLRGVSPRELVATRIEQRRVGDALHLTLHGAATFVNLLAVRRALAALEDDVGRVVIDLDHVRLVDHTFLNRLASMAEEWPSATLEYRGTDGLRPVSSHPHASRRRAA